MSDASEEHSAKLHRVIDEVRKRVWSLLRWHGIFMAFFVGLFYVLVGILTAQLVPQIGHWAPIYWFFFAVLCAGSYWFFGIRPRRDYDSDEQIALLIQREMPELGDVPINSVQLEKGRVQNNRSFSASMVEAYLRWATEGMGNISSRLTISDVPVFHSFFACLGLAVVILILVLTSPGALRTGWGRLRGDIPQPEGVSSETGELRMRDLDVTYYYPDYLDRKAEHVAGDDGHLEGPAGTRIRLAGEVRPEVEAVRMIVDGEEHRTVQLEEGGRFELEYSMLDDGEYYLESAQSPTLQTDEYDIRIVRDAPPEIRISQIDPMPGQDDVVKLQEGDAVRINYESSDDFGLSAIFLEYRHNGEAQQQPIRSLSGTRQSVSGSYEWLVPTEILQRSGETRFRVGARDEDNISGPKVAYSRWITIQSDTEEMQHQRATEGQEQLLRRMVKLLGAELVFGRKEGDGGTTGDIRGHVLAVLDMNRRVIAQTEADPLADGGMYEALNEMMERRKQEAERLRTESAALSNGDGGKFMGVLQWAVPRIEHDILRLDDFLQMGHMRTVKRMAERLKEMQKSLSEMLEKMRGGELSDEERARFNDKVREMQRIKKRLQQQMAQTARQIKRGFFNPDALEMAGNDDELSSALKNLEEMGQRGDLNGAMEEAQRLQNQLDEMLNSVGESGKNLAQSRVGPRMEKMREMSQQLRKMHRKQSGIAGDTQDALDEMRNRAREQLQESFEERIQRNITRAEEIEGDLRMIGEELRNVPELEKYRELRGELRSMLDDLSETRRAGQSGENSLEVDESTRQQLESIYHDMSNLPEAEAASRVEKDAPQAVEDAQRLQNMLEKRRLKKSTERVSVLNSRMKNYERVLGNGQIPAKIVDRMNENVEKGGDIHSDLKDLLENMQDRMQKQMTGSMQSEMNKLQQRQKQAGEGMQELMEQMSEQMRGPIGESVEQAEGHMENAAQNLSDDRVGSARKEQEQALEAIQKGEQGAGKAMRKMEQQMQGRRVAMPEQDGQSGRADGRVRIPEPSSSQSAEEFRQEIRTILEGGVPDLYRDSNQEYYEELVQ